MFLSKCNDAIKTDGNKQPLRPKISDPLIAAHETHSSLRLFIGLETRYCHDKQVILPQNAGVINMEARDRGPAKR